MPENIFNQNDSIVDKDADCQAQSHQRHIIQRKVHRLHQKERGNNGGRYGKAADDRSPKIAQEHISYQKRQKAAEKNRIPDIGNILAYLSIGDRPQEVERLVSALAEIKRRYHTDGAGLLSQEYIDPEVAASPQEAFYAPKKSLPLRETEGMVCSEFVMCYPPGIPILAPGERITAQILDYIEYAKAKGCSMTGPEDPDILRLNVLA